jgi:hypothetical protein
MSLRSLAIALSVAVASMVGGTARAQEALPAGHPGVGAGQNPHGPAGGSGGGGGMPGVFEPPPDAESEDPTLAPGTIEVDLRDADDHPVARETVNLGIIVNSIAKGDSRQHLQQTTDDLGRAVFSRLELGSNIAYRVSCGYQGGLFAASPFQLAQAKAMRVVLHVYPVTRDLQQALVVSEVTVAAEVREDRIQVEEAMTVYNLGRTAWQPDGVTMPLPEGYAAFNAQASMSDQTVSDDHGTASLHGTFPPGRSAVEFRWQIPWSEEANVDFDVGLPPHVAIARVMMPASPDIKLSAVGFPTPDVRHDAQGQSFLVTERRVRPEEPKLANVNVGIHNLPTAGPGRTVAMVLAGCGVALGLAFAFGYGRKPPTRAGTRARRAALLDDLFELERARATGEVGPKTYERSKREILDALSRLLALG